MKVKLQRKCFMCKEAIQIDHDRFIKLSKGFCHSDCYLDFEFNKKKNLKENNYDKILIKIEELEKQTRLETKEAFDKDRLYRWLQQTYQIVLLPSSFYIKMDSVYNGEYKSLSMGIPAEDLLSMWSIKINELNKIAYSKNQKGYNLTGIVRLYYDMAILLSNYDSYLKWKESQKIKKIELERIKEESQNKIDYQQIENVKDLSNGKNIKSNVKTFNIEDILDDI